jgi:hypothetical protein
MSEQSLSFEQVETMRAAIDMVVSSLGEDVRRRPEVASVIVPHAGVDGHSALTLANLALEKMGLAIRVSEKEDEAQKVG